MNMSASGRKLPPSVDACRQPTSFRMHDDMRLGAPMLRVRDLETTLRFYLNDFGLLVNRKYDDPSDDLQVLELGFRTAPKNGESILTLKHDPHARETRHDFAGLYHYAVLVPDRRSLASTYLAIGTSGAPFEGFADHTVSESLYLHDAERNGIEIYADRPRNTWGRFMELMKKGESDGPREFLALNKPLDFNSMLREMNKNEREDPSPFPSGARIGHMHLRVTNLERSVGFYHERLGLDVIGNLPSLGAAFLSAGGYHHHIGLNTWHSLGGSPHEQGDAGLECLQMVVPERTVLNSLASQFPEFREDDGRLAIIDPDGIRILVEAARPGR